MEKIPDSKRRLLEMYGYVECNDLIDNKFTYFNKDAMFSIEYINKTPFMKLKSILQCIKGSVPKNHYISEEEYIIVSTESGVKLFEN